MNTERIVTLNIGGVYYWTRRTTLLESNSFFAGAVRSNADGCEIFVDRDPTHFRHVLNWMRGVKYLPEDDATLGELAWEADYYCMHDMKTAIANAPKRYSIGQSLTDISAGMRG